jgi:hypothetical protein
VGTTILQNGLKSRLPASFLAEFPQGVEISYSVIPFIKKLPEPLRSQVQAAFANSISNIWIAVVIIGAAGFVATLPMKQMTLHMNLDENWGFGTNESSPESNLEAGTSRAALEVGSDGEKQTEEKRAPSSS